MNAHIRMLKPLGCPQGVDPRTWRQEVEKRLNDLLDRAMSLITALDCMEADCDLEETADDEFSLGWPERGPSAYGVQCDDREMDNCDLEDSHDAEADSRDEETIMWGDDLASQEVLVHLG